MKDQIIIISTPRNAGKNTFYEKFINESAEISKPMLDGIGGCGGRGFVRGEVIKREDNVTHVRFKSV